MRKKMDITKDSLILGDCLTIMKYWNKKGTKEFIDLCYIDPPFNSKRDYNILFTDDTELSEKAFTDVWSRTKYTDELEELNHLNPNLYAFLKLLETTKLPTSCLSYLTIMGITCWHIREMLKPTGSFYYHCDPTMSHYIKIMLDYIFGGGNFRNEIVWHYRRWSSTSKNYQRMHDILFFYTKTDDYTFNVQYQEYSKPDTIEDTVRGIVEGKLVRLKDKNGNYIKRETENKGVSCHDVFDIQHIQPTANERLGYPTQKPEALLERIIKASSNPNDLVVDFYNGGGTTVAVAAKNNRRYIGVDINSRAIAITEERLNKLRKETKKDFIIQGIPRSSKQLRKLVEDNKLGADKKSEFALEDHVVKYYLEGVVGNEKKVGDNSIDGVFGFSFNKKQYKGIVQVTKSASINHFKAFCSEIGKSGDIGVYISFEDTITDGMIRKANSYGKLGNVNVVQILTLETLVDKGKQFDIPKEILEI